MGGWLEQWGIKLISTQVVVQVEVGVELGKKQFHRLNQLNGSWFRRKMQHFVGNGQQIFCEQYTEISVQ